MESLIKRVKVLRCKKLLALLKAPFPFEYEMKKPSLEKAAAHAAEQDALLKDDDDLCARVMEADPATLTPRKLAMCRMLQKSRGMIEQLEAEKKTLQAKADAEREAAALKLAVEGQELRRLRNYVQQLEQQKTAAVQQRLREAKRALVVQQCIRAGIEKRAQALTRTLQQARDDSATDRVVLQRAEQRAKEALDAAEEKALPTPLPSTAPTHGHASHVSVPRAPHPAPWQ